MPIPPKSIFLMPIETAYKHCEDKIVGKRDTRTKCPHHLAK